MPTTTHAPPLAPLPPPTPDDYQVHLASRLSLLRGHQGYWPGAIPDHALSALATASRRAAYAEDTIALLRACNDEDEMRSILDTCDVPL